MGQRKKRGDPAFYVYIQESYLMTPEIRNILSDLPSALNGEVFDTIINSTSVRIERIVSNGQATPEGHWYDQTHDEWVLVLTGGAELLLDDGQAAHRLTAGDHILIPAGCRHRVVWTDTAEKTVWLAIHISSDQPQ
jgi:cupin 2 domain-containing protein